MKRISIFIFVWAVVTTTEVLGQVTFQLFDDVNVTPIEGVLFSAKPLSGGKVYTGLSDASGKVLLSDITFPILIEARHLHFEVFRDTLYERTSEASYRLLLTEKVQQLNEVVVTGQYEPQSVRNSVYQVKTIDAATLQAQGANSLLEVLSQSLNTRFSRDNATGSSGIKLQGLSGQYVKVLIDGAPLEGRSGVSNEIDLNQINVQDIAQIEIVEGPMAVNYGADALAGVINIITHKTSDVPVQISATLQEESVGKEYRLFQEGIHSPSISAAFQLTPAWQLRAGTRWNRFGGWQGSGEGRDKSWYPKTQFFHSGLIHFQHRQLKAHYRIEHLDEKIENLGSINDRNPLKDPFAIDEDYQTQRWTHQLQGKIDGDKLSFHPVISYTDYQRTTRQYRKVITSGAEQNTTDKEQDTTFYHSLFLRNTLFNTSLWRWHSLQGKAQMGVEAKWDQAGGTKLSEGDKNMTNWAFFLSTELIWEKLKIRPGIRFSHNSIFETSPTASLHIKYDLNTTTQLRLGYGRGFRTPSIRELYHEFIDANHHILGNEDLRPEYSHHIHLDLTKPFEKHAITLHTGAFYNHIQDLISYVTPEKTNQITTYTNFSMYRTLGVNLNGEKKTKKTIVKVGFSYLGRYQRISPDGDRPLKKFVFSPEARIQYQYQPWEKGPRAALFYKFNGPLKSYRWISQDNGEGRAELQGLEAFHLMDATLSQSWRKGLTLSLGVRNLFDITSVNNSFSGGGAHSSSQKGQSPVSYGRSYFMQLKMEIKGKRKGR